jgi:hypothetical protein
MDTDDLSNEAYEAVISTAERFNHDLTLPFGCLSYECEDEAEYLREAERLIKKYLKHKYMDALMDDIFFGNPPDKEDFQNTLLDILHNINEVRKIPIKKRTFDF